VTQQDSNREETPFTKQATHLSASVIHGHIRRSFLTLKKEGRLRNLSDSWAGLYTTPPHLNIIIGAAEPAQQNKQYGVPFRNLAKSDFGYHTKVLIVNNFLYIKA
jgi:hypothetical protein